MGWFVRKGIYKVKLMKLVVVITTKNPDVANQHNACAGLFFFSFSYISSSSFD